MDHIKGSYGKFLFDHTAGYEIYNINTEVPWDYIYQNRDILLRVDQNGPVYAQAHPPKDILLFKRDKDDRFSKWVTWLQCDKINNGIPFNNFFRPVIGQNPSTMPSKISVRYLPEKAVYCYRFEGIEVETTLFIPQKGIEIISKVKISNIEHDEVKCKAIPALIPYINPAQIAPWDKPEWYIKAGVGIDRELVFWSQLFSSECDAGKRRAVVLWSTLQDATSFEISLEKFLGAGDTSHPQAVYDDQLRITHEDCKGIGECSENNIIHGYPSVYAVAYQIHLNKGESKEFTQVLSMLDSYGQSFDLPLDEAKRSLRYFDEQICEREILGRQQHYQRIFNKRRIKTNDKMLDYYVNTWIPLQMDWVASLDRGWPTGMRGGRDCANDFMGELAYDPDWAKQILLLICECQRTDGWIPRQISASGRNGKHDLRNFVDAGAFALEFAYEFLCASGNGEILSKKVQWLDDEQESTVWDHLCCALDYYLEEENIGEHGLCKIRNGDWLDSVNNAGLKGRGETVMVTNQVIMAINYMSEIAHYYNLSFQERYLQAQIKFSEAIIKHAYNKEGFFNGVFTDQGEWIFSHCDADGESRPYVCANAYSVISGVADEDMRKGVLRAYQRLKCESGYRLFFPALGKKPIRNAGRNGTGDGPEGLFENATPYNHGSHGFLGRSLACMGCQEELYEVLQYMLPYDQEKHPTDQACTAPYAVVNCWQRLPVYKNRGGLTFLTGSIAMALRIVYNWMIGIRADLDALVLDPCVSTKLGDIEVTCEIRGKKIQLYISHNIESSVKLNGEYVHTRRYSKQNRRMVLFIPYELLDNENVIELELNSNIKGVE